jgi:hypothetical protein
VIDDILKKHGWWYLLAGMAYLRCSSMRSSSGNNPGSDSCSFHLPCRNHDADPASRYSRLLFMQILQDFYEKLKLKSYI